MKRTLLWLAVGLGLLAVTATAASIVLLALTWETPRPEGAAFPSFGLEVADRVQFALVAVIGAFIAARRPEHPIGWLAAVAGLGFPLQNFAEGYARYALETAPGALPGGMLAAWGTNWLWALTYPLPALLFVLFPTGRPPSPRWRPLVWTAGILGATVLLATALRPGALISFPERANPFGVPALGTEALLVAPISGLMACFLLGAVSLGVRFRRARGEERAQMKWLLLAAALFVVFIAGSASTIAIDAPALGGAQRVGSILVGVALSAAIAVAILRYRLYDIDRIISRTVAYALLTGLLAAVYLAGVLALSRLLAPLGAGSELSVAAATLAAAAVFAPARRRIQASVDRRFNRARYDAEGVVEGFRDRLRDEVELGDVVEATCVAAVRTVEPAKASLWLRGTGSAT